MYIIFHSIILYIHIYISIIQIGYLQTWLLYHNALSAGVAIEDVLKYARKTKESAIEDADNSINDLRAQLAEQQRTIKMLLEDKEKNVATGGAGISKESHVTSIPGHSPTVIPPKSTVVSEFEMTKRSLLNNTGGSAGSMNKNYGAVLSIASSMETSSLKTKSSISSANNSNSNKPFEFSLPTSFPLRDNK